MALYAHTLPDFPDKPELWEPLFTAFGAGEAECHGRECEACQSLDHQHGHSNKVAWRAAYFAAEMFDLDSVKENAWEWGYVLGLWHDLGKFDPRWQRYLASQVAAFLVREIERIDHSTAGARHAVTRHPILGHLLAYAIAGHHTGLLDAEANGTCQRHRLEKADSDHCAEARHAAAAVLEWPVPKLPAFLPKEEFAMSFFVRMLFSCLVDADFLATEAFMNPTQAAKRPRTPQAILPQISELVDGKIDGLGLPAPGDVVNLQRRRVVEACRAAATLEPGLFSLTVPTGGGKTLSSLSFALRHALAHGQRRVIYVVPFTSIIEQNAKVIRDIVSPLEAEGSPVLIEHHSALDPNDESEYSRLAAENWDAPIIITTAVQFYESLFAAKTSRTRKLHNIANAVVILDEAQTLPVDYLSPCLGVLQELADRYHTSVVLCTATQPAVEYQEPDFPIGLKGVREIVPDTRSLFAALKRVEVEFAMSVSDADLALRLRACEQVLCIVNRRQHARAVFELLPREPGTFHLSALMCPQHRSQVLATIKSRLVDKAPTRVIATQLVEAGVDLDFPVVYRALAGLDSIAQAAGRCNRNGSLPEPGRTVVFEPEDQKAETYFRETAQVARELVKHFPDLLDEAASRKYFDLYYYRQKARWDRKGILGDDKIHLNRANPRFPFRFQYASIAHDFRLIEDYQVPIIVSYDERAKELISELRNPAVPLNRKLLRGLQRYTVQIPPKWVTGNPGSFEFLRDGQFTVLTSMDINYSPDFGVFFPEEIEPGRLIVSH